MNPESEIWIVNYVSDIHPFHNPRCLPLQKGGVPAAPSGTATLLRLSPNHQFYPRTLLIGYALQVPPAFMA